MSLEKPANTIDDIYAGEGEEAPPVERLEGEPTEQLYSELQRAYAFFNERLFDRKLPQVLITLQRRHHTEGYWSPQRFSNTSGTRAGELALNPCYFAVRSVVDVLATLVHQQAHVWQSHFGKPGRRGYHNREWAMRMRALGLHPSSTDKPGGDETGEMVGHYIVAGGAFEMAAAQLISQNDFALTWYDRFPVAQEGAGTSGASSIAALPLDVSSEKSSAEVAQQDGPEHQLALSDGHPPGTSPVSAAAPSIASLLAHHDAQPESAMQVLQGHPAQMYPALGLETKDVQRPGSKKTRHKFTCPGCGDSAWGKPSLQLKCMQCDEPLRATGANAAEEP